LRKAYIFTETQISKIANLRIKTKKMQMGIEYSSKQAQIQSDHAMTKRLSNDYDKTPSGAKMWSRKNPERGTTCINGHHFFGLKGK
jgi:isochorismate hydrolase